jgi:hypothetical protein
MVSFTSLRSSCSVQGQKPLFLANHIQMEIKRTLPCSIKNSASIHLALHSKRPHHPHTTMKDKPTFFASARSRPEKSVNPLPEGQMDRREQCWFCGHSSPKTRPECTRCKSCFLSTKAIGDGTNIEWHLAFLDNLQSSEERKNGLKRVARELGNRATNVAVCGKDRVTGTKVILRQLNGKITFSIMKTGENLEEKNGNRKTRVKKWEQSEDIELDDRRVLEQLIAFGGTHKRCEWLIPLFYLTTGLLR